MWVWHSNHLLKSGPYVLYRVYNVSNIFHLGAHIMLFVLHRIDMDASLLPSMLKKCIRMQRTWTGLCHFHQ